MITHDFIVVNLDTDSISFCKKDGSPFSMEERFNLLNELNNILPEHINFADDGYFSKVIVLKSKNYILKEESGKVKIKGSALKSSKTEKGLKDFIGEIIKSLLDDNKDNIINIYNKYVKEIHNIKEMSRWVSKKTITESVINPGRTTEQKILDALGNRQVQQGDKYYMYFTKNEQLKLLEEWDILSPDHDIVVLLKKLYSTLIIFENVIDINLYPKYHLKNKKIQEQLLKVLND